MNIASPPAVRKTADAQVNVRMDSELKHAGDAALAEAGWSPTQAVRALWTYAAQHKGEPDAVASVFSSDRAPSSKTDEKDGRVAHRRDLAARGPKLMEEAYRSLGMPWPPEPAGWTDEGLKEEAYAERFGEGRRER